MAPSLTIQRVELIDAKTIKLKYRPKSASAVILEILWSIGNVQSTSEEDEIQEAVTLTAEYETREEAEDALAEVSAFIPGDKGNHCPTPWADRVRAGANFELVRVNIDPQSRRTLSMRCLHADRADLLLAADDFGNE